MAADKAGSRSKVNRSAPVRDALREHPRRMELKVKEGRDREGYLKQSQTPDEWEIWEKKAVWPGE